MSSLTDRLRTRIAAKREGLEQLRALTAREVALNTEVPGLIRMGEVDINLMEEAVSALADYREQHEHLRREIKEWRQTELILKERAR